MGRQRTIDREKLLEAIFDIVMEQGAAALTIDTVAKKMGISKGGVQYCFNSKEAMIDAMFEHWEGGYEARFNQVVANVTQPIIALEHIFMQLMITISSLLPKEPA